MDPWGRGEGEDVAALHQFRLFWSTDSALLPAGARGTMVIISPGPDGRYSFPAGSPASPDSATEPDFAAFDPGNPGDDIFFAFNAGIQ